MKVGSFGAGKKCGYGDAQSLAIYEKYFFSIRSVILIR